MIQRQEVLPAVIFDMDGVIFDTERLYIDCCKELTDKYHMGKEADVEALCHRCIGITGAMTRRMILETYGEDFPVEEFSADVYRLFQEKFGDGKQVIKPGVHELFSYLKDEGYRIALASSTQTKDLTVELDHAGLLQNFDVVVGGEQVTRSKPEPDIFLRAAELLGENAEDCYVIEDSHNGIRAAHAAGMHPIMVPDLLPATEEMKEKAEAVLPSLVEVKEYFAVLRQHQAQSAVRVIPIRGVSDQ